MAGFETQFERLEMKYLIDELTAKRIRRDIEPFCSSDPHNGMGSTWPGEDPIRRGYGISSLYLDSPGLALYRAKERGESERVKLRVRTYRNSSYVVLELKRKVSDVIHKTRVQVERARVEPIVRGLLPETSDPAADRFLTDFALTASKVGAQPTLHVRYDREAYSSEVDSYARVTFDRRIEARRTQRWDLEPGPDGWISFDDARRHDLRDRDVVLELKCQSFLPWWITDLVRKHALERSSISKYGIGIYLTGNRWETSMPRSARALM